VFGNDLARVATPSIPRPCFSNCRLTSPSSATRPKEEPITVKGSGACAQEMMREQPVCMMAYPRLMLRAVDAAAVYPPDINSGDLKTSLQGSNSMLKIAILDDYAKVALQSADWSVLQGRAEITVFDRHLSFAAPNSASPGLCCPKRFIN
jgi:hypothetical protein